MQTGSVRTHTQQYARSYRVGSRAEGLKVVSSKW
jgi:hypothetical protein